MPAGYPYCALKPFSHSRTLPHRKTLPNATRFVVGSGASSPCIVSSWSRHSSKPWSRVFIPYIPALHLQSEPQPSFSLTPPQKELSSLHTQVRWLRHSASALAHGSQRVCIQ